MSTNTATQNHPAITSDHLRRLAVVYMRQSTEEQVQKKTGSTQYQRNLADIAPGVRLVRFPDKNNR